MTVRDDRLAKLEELRRRGDNPYQERFARSHTLAEARASVADQGLVQGEPARAEAEIVRLAGRVVSYRDFGGLAFGVLQDHSGRLQVTLDAKTVGEARADDFRRLVDVGDFVGVQGKLYLTRRGELSVDVASFELLSKSLRPLPEKWHGLKDQELRFRHRYLDLLANPVVRDVFRTRTAVVRALRRFLDAAGFEEVETPMLVTKPSGALAKPFVSHHHALDMPVYLRIAPETYLKRLVAGGYDRVYELGRCFRNEGMDPSHLQDFTMLEWYAAFWNFQDNMDFTEALLQDAIRTVSGGLVVDFAGHPTDFSGPWPRHTLRELILRDSGLDLDTCRDGDSLRAAIRERKIRLDVTAKEWETLSRASLVDQLWKKVSRPKIDRPTFVTSHPADLSPLARRNDQDPAVVDRFQLVVHGWELINAYSELVDPLDQRARMEEQAAAKAQGDEEALDVDEDYLVAMEYGMPPMSGFGLGIDRFVALLCGCDNLREVVFFPLMRPAPADE
jgi:lysyl-tRNA synthetase class 2